MVYNRAAAAGPGCACILFIGSIVGWFFVLFGLVVPEMRMNNVFIQSNCTANTQTLAAHPYRYCYISGCSCFEAFGVPSCSSLLAASAAYNKFDVSPTALAQVPCARDRYRDSWLHRLCSVTCSRYKLNMGHMCLSIAPVAVLWPF